MGFRCGHLAQHEVSFRVGASHPISEVGRNRNHDFHLHVFPKYVTQCNKNSNDNRAAVMLRARRPRFEVSNTIVLSTTKPVY